MVQPLSMCGWFFGLVLGVVIALHCIARFYVQYQEGALDISCL